MNEDQRLRAAASRLAQFDGTSPHFHTVAFLCGGLFALRKALSLGWEHDRESRGFTSEYRNEIRRVALDLRSERPTVFREAVLDDEMRIWLAGHFVNSAIMRAAAAADSLEMTIQKLAKKAQRPPEKACIAKVRKYVNYLKHELQAYDDAPPFPNVEETVEAIEAILEECETLVILRPER